MPRSTSLAEVWDAYYRRGYQPSTKVDALRHALLSGKTVGPLEDPTESARLAGLVTVLERLGYVVERGRGKGDRYTYRVVNVEHRPSPEDFDRERARHRTAPTNGHGPPPRRTRASSISTLAAMLPQIGTDLVVTATGFDPDGGPFLVVTSTEGTRYACAITETTPARDLS